MSLKLNIAANYVSQIYLSILGIVMVPIYVKYMGIEAYGLVGFFALLQGWLLLLDMGLSSTIARESSLFNGGASTPYFFQRLLRAFEYIYIGLSICTALIVLFSAKYIAVDWLKVESLPVSQVYQSIVFMGLIIALRLISGLYKGIIIGSEELIWLSGFNVIIASIRFISIIPILIFVDSTPITFFSFQLVVAILELCILFLKSKTVIQNIKTKTVNGIPRRTLSSAIKFSASVGFTTAIWVMVTQTDKLLLSKFIPLVDYAYFTVAVLAASAITLVSIPISGALQPRLSKLAAEGDEVAFIRLYRQATQLVGVIVVPCVLILALFGQSVLWVWTQNEVLISQMTNVLALYACGNGLLAFGAFPYYLQFAKGNIRLHIIGNILFLVFMIPMIVWFTLNYGPDGAAWAWLVINAMYLILWVAVVHRKFLKGLHISWLVKDVLSILLFPLILALAMKTIIVFPNDRYQQGAILASIGIVLLLASAISSSAIRKLFFKL